MEMHTPYISNITFSLSKSNAKDTMGLKTKIVRKPLRLEVTKSHSLISDIRTLDLLFSNTAQGHSDHRECPTASGTSARNVLVTGHPTSERSSLLFCCLPTQQPEKIASCAILASVLTNKLKLLPREAHSPGKLIFTSHGTLQEEEGQAKTLLKNTSPGYYHYIQTPKAIASAGTSFNFSSLTLIYTS